MDSNNFDDEIEELDEEPSTTQEITDTEMPEDYLDENYEESYDDSYNQPKFGEREYKNAKDENGHHDKDYYKKREQELDEKVDEARAEKGRNWKKKDSNDDGPVKADGSNTENKNRRDRLKDNINLERAKYDRWQNKLDGIKAKTYQTMHPVEAAKEEAKEKAKDVAKTTGKAAAKGAAKAAKATGRLVAAGGKAVIAFLASHPIVLGALVVIIILFMVLFMLFSNPGKDYSSGYFDRDCDYNLTYVDYNCDDNVAGITLKNFVIGSAYAYSKDYEFSSGALKALMIAVKTSVLANGGYTNSSKSVTAGCSVKYENVPSEEKNTLEKYYNDIERYLYISKSHTSSITYLSGGDALNISDEYIGKIANSKSNGYESILREVYGGSKTSSSSKPRSKGLDPSKETIYIGDSRMSFMKTYGIVNDNNAIYYGANGYCWFRQNTRFVKNGEICPILLNSNTNDTGGIGAINLANQKMEDGKSYNIVIWLGVNDTEHVNQYFEVYKALAEDEWSNHNIYIAQVGPVNEIKYSQESYHRKNQDVIDYNDTMSSLISNAGLDNLIYLDLGLTQESINWNESDGVHYGKSDCQKIFDLFQSSSGSTSGKGLYDLGDYCDFHKQPKGNGCDAGWWWPLGSGEPVGGIYTEEPTSLTYISRGFTYSITYTGRNHMGVDIGVPYDNIIVASRSGTVNTVRNGCPTTSSGSQDECGGGGGNAVYITHDDGTESRYLHMTKDSIVVEVGQRVAQGQKIGLVGSSGASDGPHLHFEILINGKQVDPLDYISTTNLRPGATGCSYSTDQAGVCRAIKELGLPDEASAAILTNIAAEGGYKTDNLENCYETNQCCIVYGAPYGYCVYGSLIGPYGSDEAYTTAVSNGTYQHFADDHAGYGLIQWTDSGRKANLLRYFEELRDHGEVSSIADIKVQVGFMVEEMNTNYKSVKDALYDPARSVYDKAYYFCRYYENPAGDCNVRSTNAERILKYYQNGCSD